MNISTARLRLAAGAAIDLHLHTINSDGSWMPEQLLDHLVRERFGLAAIADHDRPDIAAALRQLAGEKGLPLLAAVEMSTAWKGEMTDLLCYGFDPGQPALDDLVRDLLRRQRENTREVWENLQRRGCALPPEALSAILAKPSSQQPHDLVSLLQAHSPGLDQASAGQIVLEAGCAFETNHPAAIAEAAHRNGAVCLLAHPGRGDGFLTYDVDLLDRFRQEVPIDGLEVYYPTHTPEQTAMYREYTRRHGLLASAGSDSHGPEKPPIKYRAELCRGLLERAGIRIE